jgi:hypothetical protein
MTQITPQAVLDQRPKFYGRSRRFKTYGYGGRSLRPFLRPKVLLVVFLVFSKMEAEMSNFTMGVFHVFVFLNLGNTSQHLCLRHLCLCKTRSRDCPHGEVVFSNSDINKKKIGDKNLSNCIILLWVNDTL